MVDQRPTPPSSDERRPAPLFNSGVLVALGLTVALMIGIGLGGGLRWRYHRLILQSQGAVLGLVVGYIAGRISSARR
jgi:hypothetical protein